MMLAKARMRVYQAANRRPNGPVQRIDVKRLEIVAVSKCKGK